MAATSPSPATASLDAHRVLVPIPSPPPPDAAPLPPLPPEIIGHTIELSRPHVAFDTFAERYSILLRFCLVNSTWHWFAKALLLRDVCFKGEFDKEGHPLQQWILDQNVLHRTKALRLLFRYTWDLEDLTALFERSYKPLQQLEELWIGSSADNGVYVGDVSLVGTGRWAPNLKLLTFDLVLQSFPSDNLITPPLFAQLRSLGISEVAHSEHLLHALRDCKFPSMRNFYVSSWAAKQFTTSDLVAAFATVGPQLVTLGLALPYNAGADWSTHVLSKCVALKHFTLDDRNLGSPCDSLTLLQAIPSKLDTLRLRPPRSPHPYGYQLYSGTVAVFNEWPSCLATLRQVTVAAPVDLTREDRDRLSQVQAVAAQKGVALKTTAKIFSEYAIRWEDSIIGGW